MVIAVASGKGGTGKTTFSVNLAAALRSERAGRAVQLLDCDVEEPNDHLFVTSTFDTSHRVRMARPRPIPDTCTGCRLCAESCRFNAIAVAGTRVLIFDDLCHGCGVCTQVCPVGALAEESVDVGTVGSATVDGLTLVEGRADIGQSVTPLVIASVKERIDPLAITIIDAPPGTTCSVVSAVDGADAVILVTEPTPFGLHDLELAAALVRKLGRPAAIVVNQSNGIDASIEAFAAQSGIPIAGRIPFRREFAQAYSRGELLVDAFPELRTLLLEIFHNLDARVPREWTLSQFPVEPRGAVPRGTAMTDRASSDTASTAAASSHNATPPTSSVSEEGRPAPEIVVISGKGGTGKTSLTAALVKLAGSAVIADTDVDAADLHLLLHPTVREANEFHGSTRALINADLCTACGLCADACRFRAISVRCVEPAPGDQFVVNEYLCEGCGMCGIVCPVGAVTDVPRESGHWYASQTEFGPMVHARLGVAEENSGRLVTEVRRRAREAGAHEPRGTTSPLRLLTDGPPGTGCPVTASITGASLALVVTEPTVSGVHDLERVLELTAHFGVTAAVVINKADINPEQASIIRERAARSGAEVVGEIPFDRSVVSALTQGRTLLDASESVAGAVKQIRRAIEQQLEQSDTAG